MSHKQKHVGPTSSRVSPPLGALPSQPDSPEVQLPPPERICRRSRQSP